MTINVLSRFLPPLAIAVALLLASGAVTAQTAPERTELRRDELAGVANTELIMSDLKLAPGASVPRHRHHGEEYLYVIDGGSVVTPDGKVMTLHSGATLHFARGELHGGFTATGDATIKVVTVHIVDRGKPLYVEAE